MYWFRCPFLTMTSPLEEADFSSSFPMGYPWADDTSFKNKFRDLQSGIVSVGWDRVASVEQSRRDEPPRFLIREPSCQKFQINPEELRQHFEVQ